MSLMRCAICQKFWHITTVPSQIWDGTDNNCKIKHYYFVAFFSLLFHRYLSLSLSDSISFLLSLSLSISSLSSLLKKVAQDHFLVLATISLPHFPVLTADLANPRRWSHCLILHNSLLISLPLSPALVADIHSPHRWPLDLS